MAINFPDSPSLNDTHTVGDKTWTWDGTAWTLVQNNVADHGNLGGLADDDHTQYLLADGTRTATELTVTNDLTVDTDTLHVDSTNNRVGIGTSSPAEKLEVVDSVATVRLSSSVTVPTANTELQAIDFYQSDASGGAGVSARIVGSANNLSGAQNIEFHTGQAGASSVAERMRIDSNGKVGINDSTPSYTLDVNGDINATGDLRIGGTAVGEAVTTWQPTWDSGVTVGNGTVTTSYYVLNDFVYYTVDFELGSTSAITGDIRIYHPFTADSKWQVAANLSGFAYDYSSATYYAVMGRTYLEARSTVRYARQHAGTNQAIYARQFSSTEPFTWGTSDRLVFSTWYKKA